MTHGEQWKGGRHGVTVPNDERQHYNLPTANLEESLSEEEMLFAFVHSMTMQLLFWCAGYLQENDQVMGALCWASGLQIIL